MKKNRFKITTTVNLILRQEDKILLLKRTNTGNQDGMYNLIAGHLEADELGSEAIVREAKEEAGIDININDIRFVYLVQRLPQNNDQEEYLDIYYETTVWQGEITNTEPDKCLELGWYSIDNLPEKTIPLLSIVLEQINKGLNYSEHRTEPT